VKKNDHGLAKVDLNIERYGPEYCKLCVVWGRIRGDKGRDGLNPKPICEQGLYIRHSGSTREGEISSVDRTAV
jgi:hypothetical protein